ncbi:hypothetical protein ZWY2020_025646 [Hordeum vulgare]|nr:hypothetical protein ZWY2020_025646 [Hordeum vulgare]
MAAPQPDVVGVVPLSQGVTGAGEESGRHLEVEKWLGGSSFPRQRFPHPLQPEVQVDPAYRATMVVVKCVHMDLEGGHRWCNAQDAMLSLFWHEGVDRDRNTSRHFARMNIVTSTYT